MCSLAGFRKPSLSGGHRAFTWNPRTSCSLCSSSPSSRTAAATVDERPNEDNRPVDISILSEVAICVKVTWVHVCQKWKADGDEHVNWHFWKTIDIFRLLRKLSSYLSHPIHIKLKLLYLSRCTVSSWFVPRIITPSYPSFSTIQTKILNVKTFILFKLVFPTP